MKVRESGTVIIPQLLCCVDFGRSDRARLDWVIEHCSSELRIKLEKLGSDVVVEHKPVSGVFDRSRLLHPSVSLLVRVGRSGSVEIPLSPIRLEHDRPVSPGVLSGRSTFFEGSRESSRRSSRLADGSSSDRSLVESVQEVQASRRRGFMCISDNGASVVPVQGRSVNSGACSIV